ncbi:hypothetical protein CYMTET_51000, partial [Cymbomonas tetramitiformis]
MDIDEEDRARNKARTPYMEAINPDAPQPTTDFKRAFADATKYWLTSAQGATKRHLPPDIHKALWNSSPDKVRQVVLAVLLFVTLVTILLLPMEWWIESANEPATKTSSCLFHLCVDFTKTAPAPSPVQDKAPTKSAADALLEEALSERSGQDGADQIEDALQDSSHSFQSNLTEQLNASGTSHDESASMKLSIEDALLKGEQILREREPVPNATDPQDTRIDPQDTRIDLPLTDGQDTSPDLPRTLGEAALLADAGSVKGIMNGSIAVNLSFAVNRSSTNESAYDTNPAMPPVMHVPPYPGGVSEAAKQEAARLTNTYDVRKAMVLPLGEFYNWTMAPPPAKVPDKTLLIAPKAGLEKLQAKYHFCKRTMKTGWFGQSSTKWWRWDWQQQIVENVCHAKPSGALVTSDWRKIYSKLHAEILRRRGAHSVTGKRNALLVRSEASGVAGQLSHMVLGLLAAHSGDRALLGRWNFGDLFESKWIDTSPKGVYASKGGVLP